MGAGNFFQSIFDLGEVNCQALVDNHFLIFADVQEAARARHGDRQAPITITEANLSRSFFATGLSDGEGNILWGFSQWCALLKGPGFGPGEAPK